MGLDITAVSNVKILDTRPEYDEEIENAWGTEDYVHQDWINEHFPHAVPAEYHGKRFLLWQETDESESHSFRAGSYSGYGLFRSTLAGAFLGTKDLYMDRDEQNGDWEKVHRAEGNPFYELINFSDCEGVFFGPVCEKLYNDFETHRDFFVEWVGGNNPYPAWEAQGWINRYDDWLRGFDLARRDGVLSFH